jgi:hypothetical protein
MWINEYVLYLQALRNIIGGNSWIYDGKNYDNDKNITNTKLTCNSLRRVRHHIVIFYHYCNYFYRFQEYYYPV